jgi:hypothetical protein
MKKLITLFVFISLPCFLFAQKEGNIWMFGDSVRINYTNICETGSVKSMSISDEDGNSIEDDNVQINLYPNPAQNSITLRFNSSEIINANVTIMDISGRTILMKKVDQPESQISVNGLANGVYFVKIEQNGSTKINKLIINR